MGASLVYLDEPNKEIEWATGEDDRAIFACGEMQGWRLNMVSELLRAEEHLSNVLGYLREMLFDFRREIPREQSARFTFF